MPDNLALRMRPNHRPGYRPRAPHRGGENHPPHGGGQSSLVHDSLRSSRDWQDQYCFCHRGHDQVCLSDLQCNVDSKKRLQEIAEEAKFSGGLVLLLDEIHRLDKTKQDFLLPLLESGLVIMIGATTENPSFP